MKKIIKQIKKLNSYIDKSLILTKVTSSSFNGYFVELFKLIKTTVPIIKYLEEVYQFHCNLLYFLLTELFFVYLHHVYRVVLNWTFASRNILKLTSKCFSETLKVQEVFMTLQFLSQNLKNDFS